MKYFLCLVCALSLFASALAKDVAQSQKEIGEKIILKIKGIDPKDVRLIIKPDTEATFFAVTDTEVLHCGEVFRAQPLYRIAWSQIARVEAAQNMFESKPTIWRGQVPGIRLRFKEAVKFNSLLKYFAAGDGIFVFTPVVVITFENGRALDCFLSPKANTRFAQSEILVKLLEPFVGPPATEHTDSSR